LVFGQYHFDIYSTVVYLNSNHKIIFDYIDSSEYRMSYHFS